MAATGEKNELKLEQLRRKDEKVKRLDERFGQTIRKYRLQKGIRIVELSQLLGKTAVAVSNWESGAARPDADTINRLCQLLSMPVEELFSLERKDALTMEEKVLLENYRAMGDSAKALALAAVEAMADEEKRSYEKDLKENYRFLEVLSTNAAAGTGCAFQDAYPDYTFARINGRNYNSDAIVRVSGRSMEPAYYSGDLVYLKYTHNYTQGDDVVCSTADGAVIKRVGRDGLYSVNPDYPFAMHYDDDHVRVVGKVMGVVEPGDIAPDCDKPVLAEIHVYEVRQFLKKVRPES